MSEVIDNQMIETGVEQPAANEAIPLEQRTDVTVDELERMSLPYSAELYKGKVVFKHKWPPREIIQSNIHAALKAYLRHNRIGYITMETGFQLSSDHANELRFPDLAFIKRERVPKDLRRFPVMIPDLVAEIIAPQDKFERVMFKIDDYLKHGTRIVWLIMRFRKTREVMICTGMEMHSVRDVLTAPELLPGFELPVSKIFEGFPLPE